MKTMMVVVVLVAASVVNACKEGFVPSDTPGVCIEKPAEVTNNPAWVSDEKPPEDKMPSYEREGVTVENAPPGVVPSTSTAHDFKAESEQK